jgi:hypothetical protein
VVRFGVVRRAAVVVVAVMSIASLAVAACSGATNHRSTTPTSSSKQGAGAPHVTLTCIEGFPEVAPTPELTVVLGVVALPTAETMAAALQTSASGEVDPSARLFAKWGLYVRADAALELIVPDEVADRFSIGWGPPAPRTRRLVVDRCRGNSEWLAFVGGYWVRDPGCMPLLVRTGGQEQRVLIGIGAPCHGQHPPPAPTTS